MKVLVTGANGFIASNLYPLLTAAGHKAYGLVHKHQNAIPKYVETVKLDDLHYHSFDVVINLAGANIAAKPWSAKRQQELFDSRVQFTHKLFRALKNKPRILLNASAVGYYGFDDYKTFLEDTPPNGGFTHHLCSAWEKEALNFQAVGVRTTIFRLGVVLGQGGALAKMKWPFKLGLGGKIGHGKQYFPWIHIHDVCRFILSAIENEEYQGTYNLVAPQAITQFQFAQAYGKALNRPTMIPTPEFILQKLLGDMSQLLTKGQHVVPQALMTQNFQFEYKTIDAALTSLT